jgi:hypothetical protein
MSTYYGLRKSIKADELFDGRLEAFGVREEVRPEGAADRFPPYMKVREVRYLTDGRNSMEVVVYENGVPDLTVRNLWCASEKEIFHAIAEAFDTGIVSEHEPQYWGFDTQEEWDEWNEQRSRKVEESFHDELLKCAEMAQRAGEASDEANWMTSCSRCVFNGPLAMAAMSRLHRQSALANRHSQLQPLR